MHAARERPCDITREYDCFRYFALGRLCSRFTCSIAACVLCCYIRNLVATDYKLQSHLAQLAANVRSLKQILQNTADANACVTPIG